MRKYRLTDESMEYEGRTLSRIQALIDIELIDGSHVSKGDKGGWIEAEANLSQSGTCWIKDESKIFGDSFIFDNALVAGYFDVGEGAMLLDDVIANGFGEIKGNVRLQDNVSINNHEGQEISLTGNIRLYDSVELTDNVIFLGDISVRGDVHISNTDCRAQEKVTIEARDNKELTIEECTIGSNVNITVGENDENTILDELDIPDGTIISSVNDIIRARTDIPDPDGNYPWLPIIAFESLDQLIFIDNTDRSIPVEDRILPNIDAAISMLWQSDIVASVSQIRELSGLLEDASARYVPPMEISDDYGFSRF